MKTKIAALLIMAIITAKSTLASTGANLNQKVITSFVTKFGDAKEVSWYKVNNLFEVRFKMNEQIMYAYFSYEGELICVTHNILSTQLPVILQAELRNNFPNTWITELFEYSTEEETVYYITVENADQKVQLKSTGFNTWTVYKKSKKI